MFDEIDLPEESAAPPRPVSAEAENLQVDATMPIASSMESVDREPPDLEALYIEHRTLLLHIACRKFRISETEAESLMQEVFVSLMTTTTTVTNVRAWLVAAMCNASRHYWRGQLRTESLPDDFADHCDPKSSSLSEQLTMEITLRQAIDYLQPRCRDTLRLHYYEGHSAADVAKELSTTSRYAEKLIHNCLKRVREIYFNITQVKR